MSCLFWCSSQASSALVFSLRAFWRRRSSELWCWARTSSSFMYWRTRSMVNLEKLSWPLEKGVLPSCCFGNTQDRVVYPWQANKIINNQTGLFTLRLERLQNQLEKLFFITPERYNKDDPTAHAVNHTGPYLWTLSRAGSVMAVVVIRLGARTGFPVQRFTTMGLRWQKRAERFFLDLILSHWVLKFNRVLCGDWGAVCWVEIRHRKWSKQNVGF